jgi:hypothetical protein
VRAAALQAIEGRLAETAEGKVDASRLIRAAVAVDLLAGGSRTATAT